MLSVGGTICDIVSRRHVYDDVGRGGVVGVVSRRHNM